MPARRGSPAGPRRNRTAGLRPHKIWKKRPEHAGRCFLSFMQPFVRLLTHRTGTGMPLDCPDTVPDGSTPAARQTDKAYGYDMNIPVPAATVGLLILSNIFMTFAWYGHLRYKGAALPVVILASWGLAFFEYLLQVPANRIGYGHFSAAELKTIQEVISLTVFIIFSSLWLHEPLRWNHVAGFALIVLAAWIIFKEW